MSDSDTTRNKLGLAIVGCGQIVTHHLDAMMKNDDDSYCTNSKFEVRALCDPSKHRREVIMAQSMPQHSDTSTRGPAQFDSLDDLILDVDVLAQIDAVFIAVPHDLHEALAMQALQITPPIRMVVMEKPLAPTADACDRLMEASLQYNRRLIIAEQSPYWQEVILAKQLIAQGAIGSTIVSVAAYYYESMRDNITSGSVDPESGALGWRGSLHRAGGGIAIDGGLHWIRPIREMVGRRIARVVGITRTNLAPELQLEGESLAHALFQLTDTASSSLESSPRQQQQVDHHQQQPLIATYSCNMLATAPMAHDACPYFRITGTGGEIVIHGDGLFKDQPGAGGLRLYNHDNVAGKEMFPADRLGGFFLGFTGLWNDIATIIEKNDGAAAHETVVRAADDVRVVLALYKSSQTGQWESTSDL